MCRNIKPLFHFDPPATPEEIRAASLQYVRKLSGMNKPTGVNQEAFEKSIEEIARVTEKLMVSLQSTAPMKNREVEAEKAKVRNQKRFNQSSLT
jgi:hypothetical protein